MVYVCRRCCRQAGCSRVGGRVWDFEDKDAVTARGNIMIKQWISVLMFVVVMFGWGTTAGAGVSVIDPLSYWGGGAILWLGGGDTRIYAQTFIAPENDYLTRAEFVIDEGSSFHPGNAMLYNVYVMRWDVDHVTGSILYRSADLTTDGVYDNWEHVTIDSLSLALSAGESYAIFWGTSEHDQGPDYLGRMGYGFTGGDVHGGGQFVFADAELLIGQLEFTELNWELHSDLDLAIRLTFIPEPGSVMLLVISSMILHRRRSH